jgi:hypothetical protein
MSDFFNRADYTAVTAFTDPGSLVEFKFDATEQTIHNDNTAADAIVEVSFDGINVHGRLAGTGSSSVLTWSDHLRTKVWIRRVAGGPLGARMVEVFGSTR